MKRELLKTVTLLFIALFCLTCSTDDDNDDEISLDSLLDNLVTISSDLPMGNYLDLMFINENTGFVLSTKFLAKTIDGGYSWTTYEIPEFTNGGYVQFISEQIGYILIGGQYNGVLLKTTNSGQDWEEIYFNANICPYGFYFLDENTGFIVGAGLLIKTTDGGKSWTGIEREDVYQRVNFKNDKEGIVTSFFGEYLKTTDGGITWSKNKIDAFHIYDIYFVENRTLASAYHENLFDLTNNQKVVSLPSSGLRFAFLNFKCCIATGTLITGSWSSTSNIFFTNDGWKTYAQKTLSATEGIKPICAKMSDNKCMIITTSTVMILDR